MEQSSRQYEFPGGGGSEKGSLSVYYTGNITFAHPEMGGAPDICLVIESHTAVLWRNSLAGSGQPRRRNRCGQRHQLYENGGRLF